MGVDMSKLGEPTDLQTEEVVGPRRSSRERKIFTRHQYCHKQETSTKDADGSRRSSDRKTKDDMDQQRAKMSSQQKIIDSTARKEKARKKKKKAVTKAKGVKSTAKNKFVGAGVGRKLKTGNVIKPSGTAGKGTAPKRKKIRPPAMPGRGRKLTGEEALKVPTCAIKEMMDNEVEVFANRVQNGDRSSLKLVVYEHENTVIGMTRSNAGVRGEYRITKSKIVGMIDGGNRLGGGGESFGNGESASAPSTKQTNHSTSIHSIMGVAQSKQESEVVEITKSKIVDTIEGGNHDDDVSASTHLTKQTNPSTSVHSIMGMAQSKPVLDEVLGPRRSTRERNIFIPFQYQHKQDTGTKVSIAHKSNGDDDNLLGGGVESSEDDESSDELVSDAEDDVIYEVTFLDYVDKKWKTEKVEMMKFSKVEWMLDKIYLLGIDSWHPGMMPYNLATVQKHLFWSIVYYTRGVEGTQSNELHWPKALEEILPMGGEWLTLSKRYSKKDRPSVGDAEVDADVDADVDEEVDVDAG